MLRVGIVPDLSHASFRAQDEILDLCAAAGRAPVATHMNAYALHPHSRNLTDERYRRLTELGGVAGISLYVRHLSGRETVTAEDAAAHLCHYESLVPAHAGFGCDYDGSDVPEDLLRDLAPSRRRRLPPRPRHEPGADRRDLLQKRPPVPRGQYLKIFPQKDQLCFITVPATPRRPPAP